MDGHLHTGTESPPSRTTILGSFLRGRPRNSSQTHIQLSTDVHPSPSDPPPSFPQQPSSPVPQNSSRRRPGLVLPTGSMTNNNNSSSNNITSAGLGITSMLRRRRSAGNVSAQVPAPQLITASATAAAALSLGAFTGRPTQPAAVATTTAITPATTANSHRIRLVPHLDTRRSLRFDAISRDLKEGDPSLRIGRFTDRSGIGLAAVNASNSNKLAFRSKVVSRTHAEIWVESGGRFFVKDTKSSSGTFLNHIRLSLANTESKPFQIKDGDILQLGVDYQGGAEDIYKSVKIKIEIGREWQASANAFNTNALKNLKSLALPAGNGKQAVATIKLPAQGKSQIPDCCICLFSVTIRQALFIAPCSHTFHYKCIRPLLESHHPAFSCPLCRTFADLEEDVEVEIEYEDLDEVEGGFDEGVVTREGDVDVDVEVSDGQGQAVSHLHHHHKPRDAVLDDVLLGSRSNSGLHSAEREAGAETEVEGDGSGLGVVSRLRARRGAPGGGGGSGSGSGSGDRASPLADLTDEPDEEMVMDVSQPGAELGIGGARSVVVVGGDVDVVMDMDGTVGAGKRKPFLGIS